MTPHMATQCIAELQYRAQRFAESPSGAIFIYNGDVFKSDSAVSKETRLVLEDAFRPLEDLPDILKDWHPGSNGQVLDSVHPSLLPLMYGRTRILPVNVNGTSLEAKDCIKRCGEGHHSCCCGSQTSPLGMRRRRGLQHQVSVVTLRCGYQWGKRKDCVIHQQPPYRGARQVVLDNRGCNHCFHSSVGSHPYLARRRRQSMESTMQNLGF